MDRRQAFVTGRERRIASHAPAVELKDRAVTYFCFVECEILSVPHMEPLAAEDVGTALEEARRLMKRHSSAIAAHVFQGEARVGTVVRERSA
ncbi:hypothetical protein E4M02_13810 [Brevundimonas sp. S30B]|uniref:hypothetical protein n=1 Tax=unclassified Brevundimonas TaxID=2622653 RepID=UPI001072AE7F|nr:MULTISPECIES: hypothetical protein [unclassified Brevundimonas]QBX36491.1 hypothetical protein E4M01_01205 [Brevundimonas sp. MF30-B]TFW00743.1 hypothetical protein E4M02_13810 [Brevundimonas sp. S30B]